MRRVNPDQFKLFMSGEEWKASVDTSVDLSYNDGQLTPGTPEKKQAMDKLWERKSSEAKAPTASGNHGSGVHDSLREYGYEHNRYGGDVPTIGVEQDGTKIQEEGHHRIAAAADIEKETGNPVWIPTNYEKW